MEKIKIGQLNVRSLVAHFTDIKAYILDNNFDIFAVTETWLSNSILDSAVKIAGYDLFRTDRIGRGGGVAVYVNSSFNKVFINTSNVIEQLWLEVRLPDVGFVVGVIYRPPNFNFGRFMDIFDNTLSEIFVKYDKIVCVWIS